MSLETFEKLREQLLENTDWPLKYMFKFIVPNANNKVGFVVALLPEDGNISYKETKNLKYVSVTCVAQMQSADEIIDITHKASQIDGVMVL